MAAADNGERRRAGDAGLLLRYDRRRMKKRASRSRQPRGIQSIDIGFSVLDCLASASQPLPLRDIAKATGMTPSKVRFYLVSFLNLRVVSQDPGDGRYNLGPGAIKLGLAALEQFDVITASRRELFELAEKLGFTAFLAVWGNHGPTIVFRVDGRNKTVLEVRVGSVMPLLRSALGRTFLAYLPRSTTASLLRAEMSDRTPGGRQPKLTRRHVEELIARTRAHGMAVASGTVLADFTAIAAPVLDHAGFPVAAISVIGAIGLFDDSYKGKPARMLKEATSKLSAQVGWTGAAP